MDFSEGYIMKKIFFCMAEYPEPRQGFFLEYMSKANQKYSDMHGFEYIEMTSLPREEDGEFWRDNPTWLKHKVVHDWIEEGFVEDGDIVSHIDADIAIAKFDKSFEPSQGKSFGYAIDSCNTHCMGAYTIRVNDWSRNMLRNMLDEEFYQRMKDNKAPEHTNPITGQPNWELFREQASWYTMSGLPLHSWAPFAQLPNYGFHMNKSSETIYSVEELLENVEIFPTEWNVTHIPEEDGEDRFYINPTATEDTILRHFAGGRAWRAHYFTGEEQ